MFEVAFIRLDTQFHFYWFSVLCIHLKNKETERVCTNCLYENKNTSLYNIFKGIEVLYLYTYENTGIIRLKLKVVGSNSLHNFAARVNIFCQRKDIESEMSHWRVVV